MTTEAQGGALALLDRTGHKPRSTVAPGGQRGKECVVPGPGGGA